MPDTLRSVLLFVVAAIFEIGGAWLIWQGVREHRGVAWVGAGIVALGADGFVVTLQPVLRQLRSGLGGFAYGGIFVVGSLSCGVWWLTAFGPTGSTCSAPLICLMGVA